MKVLVTGGVRSGKSRHAGSLLGGGPATCVAPRPVIVGCLGTWRHLVVAGRVIVL